MARSGADLSAHAGTAPPNMTISRGNNISCFTGTPPSVRHRRLVDTHSVARCCNFLHHKFPRFILVLRLRHLAREHDLLPRHLLQGRNVSLEQIDDIGPIHLERGFTVPLNDFPCDLHLSVLGGEAILADDFADLLDIHLVAVLELDDCASLIETDLHVLHSIYLLDGHAHGVGADCSIHPKDNLFHLLEFGARYGRYCQGEDAENCAEAFHGVFLSKPPIGVVDDETKPLLALRAIQVPVHGKKRATRDSPGTEQSKNRGPDKDLVTTAVGCLPPGNLIPKRVLTDAFDEESPVRMGELLPKERRPISQDKA